MRRGLVVVRLLRLGAVGHLLVPTRCPRSRPVVEFAVPPVEWWPVLLAGSRVPILELALEELGNGISVGSIAQ